jgi:peptide-methionine (S)-S-oxide reductase
MRHKYRSAVYTFSEVQKKKGQIIATFQELSEKKLITQVLTFQNLKLQELK